MSHKTAADVADKVVDNISDAVTAISDAFHKIAPHVWQVMVHQQILNGVLHIALFVVLVALTVVSFFYVKKLHVKYEGFWNRNDPTPAFFALAIPIILALFVCVKGNSLPENLCKVVNPEYYAAYEVLDTVQDVSK